jgi:hypothetical protein
MNGVQHTMRTTTMPGVVNTGLRSSCGQSRAERRHGAWSKPVLLEQVGASANAKLCFSIAKEYHTCAKQLAKGLHGKHLLCNGKLFAHDGFS